MLHKEGYKLNNSFFKKKGKRNMGFNWVQLQIKIIAFFVIIIIVKTDSAKEYL